MNSSYYYDAKADIKGSQEYPNIRGTVYFKEVTNHVVVTAKIKGLPQSKDKCKSRFLYLTFMRVIRVLGM